MKPTEYDSFWNDTKNWRLRSFYVCHEDPRCIVPKRISWMGRTLNFAHPKSYFILFFSILVIIAVPLIARMCGWIDSPFWVALEFAVILLFVVMIYRIDIRAR